jgi:membrane-associated phospholipid phosphatase
MLAAVDPPANQSVETHHKSSCQSAPAGTEPALPRRAAINNSATMRAPRHGLLSTTTGNRRDPRLRRPGRLQLPSGHVADASLFGFCFFLAKVLTGHSRWWSWRTFWLCILALSIVLIGSSRIYLGEHWLTDKVG